MATSLLFLCVVFRHLPAQAVFYSILHSLPVHLSPGKRLSSPSGWGAWFTFLFLMYVCLLCGRGRHVSPALCLLMFSVCCIHSAWGLSPSQSFSLNIYRFAASSYLHLDSMRDSMRLCIVGQRQMVLDPLSCPYTRPSSILLPAPRHALCPSPSGPATPLPGHPWA